MKFSKPLLSGKLIKRYKRFLADIQLDDGRLITAHCPNSGRMTQCQGEGWPVLVTSHNNPKRKLQFTWEMVHNGKSWICINTQRANEIAHEALLNKQIPELAEYENIEKEKKYGKNSKIDFLLSSQNELCYVEVKSVTLTNSKGQFCFPDAPTERGRKHLDELVQMKEEGHRAVMLYIVNREDGKGFTIANFIDPDYGKKLNWAAQNGVEVLVYATKISKNEIT